MTEGGKKSVVVSVRLDEATHAGLDALAKADRRKLASYLALVLEDHLAERVEAGALKEAETKGKARKT
jgi:hypothetical protein